MKVSDFRAAARWFDLQEGPSGDHEPVEPADPGRIHAFLMRPNESEFFSNTYEWLRNQTSSAFIEYGVVEAACGMGVRAVDRMSFDTSVPDACRRCLDMAGLWQSNLQEYERLVQQRHERWNEREDRVYQASYDADLVRQYSYGNESIDDDQPASPAN